MTYPTKRFTTCNEGVSIVGKVVCQGPLGVVLLDKAPDPTSQYPADRNGYVSIYRFDRPYGRIQERHSHGYGVTDNDLRYFKAVVNFQG
jgi:hypothetical protein